MVWPTEVERSNQLQSWSTTGLLVLRGSVAVRLDSATGLFSVWLFKVYSSSQEQITCSFSSFSLHAHLTHACSIYYGATIFETVGVSDPYVTQILIGVVNFACTFLGLYAFERFGRRIPLIIGGLWQSLCLFVFAAAGTAKDPSQDKAIGKLMIVAACLFFLGMASTWARGSLPLDLASYQWLTHSVLSQPEHGS